METFHNENIAKQAKAHTVSFCAQASLLVSAALEEFEAAEHPGLGHA
jgi:hypothetical protein